MVATCLMVSTYYYILIYRYVWIYGTISDVYGVDLFAMPGMKLVVSPLEYEFFILLLAVISHFLLLVTMTRMKLLSALQLMLQLNKTMHTILGMWCNVYVLEFKVFVLVFALTSHYLLLIDRLSVPLLRALQFMFHLNRIMQVVNACN